MICRPSISNATAVPDVLSKSFQTPLFIRRTRRGRRGSVDVVDVVGDHPDFGRHRRDEVARAPATGRRAHPPSAAWCDRSRRRGVAQFLRRSVGGIGLVLIQVQRVVRGEVDHLG